MKTAGIMPAVDYEGTTSLFFIIYNTLQAAIITMIETIVDTESFCSFCKHN